MRDKFACLRLVRAPPMRPLGALEAEEDGRALSDALEACQGERESALAAVKVAGSALRGVPESCRSDREIVLAAVRQDWRALEWAAE
eukprot:2829587-Amphidinium_carterae.1